MTGTPSDAVEAEVAYCSRASSGQFAIWKREPLLIHSLKSQRLDVPATVVLEFGEELALGMGADKCSVGNPQVCLAVLSHMMAFIPNCAIRFELSVKTSIAMRRCVIQKFCLIPRRLAYRKCALLAEWLQGPLSMEWPPISAAPME